MRLTVNLEPDLYALARSLSKAEDCTVSGAVNRLIRRSLPGNELAKVPVERKAALRNGFVVTRGARRVTAEMIHLSEAEDDAA